MVYVLYLVYCYHHCKTQNKIVEAFFKFEKSDLDAKTEHLRECMSELEQKCESCFLSQELPSIMKKSHLSNIQLRKSFEGNGSHVQTLSDSGKDGKDSKVSFDITNERE